MQWFKLQDGGKSLGPSQLMPQKMTGYFQRQRQRKTHILFIIRMSDASYPHCDMIQEQR
jgi:hypothetical protein